MSSNIKANQEMTRQDIEMDRWLSVQYNQTKGPGRNRRFGCKVVLPVSPVVHNALCSVGERCEMVREFFVRVLHSTGVLCISHANVKVALGSRSPFILFLVAVTVLCYKLHLDKLRCIIQSFLIVRSVVPSDVSLVGLMIVLVDDVLM